MNSRAVSGAGPGRRHLSLTFLRDLLVYSTAGAGTALVLGGRLNHPLSVGAAAAFVAGCCCGYIYMEYKEDKHEKAAGGCLVIVTDEGEASGSEAGTVVRATVSEGVILFVYSVTSSVQGVTIEQ